MNQAIWGDPSTEAVVSAAAPPEPDPEKTTQLFNASTVQETDLSDTGPSNVEEVINVASQGSYGEKTYIYVRR